MQAYNLKTPLSYWEIKEWLSNVDYLIIGSGIVGLTCALTLKKKHPKANILILEKGFLPQGASTKNAGFACFGSLSELLDDMNHHTENEMLALVKRRFDGLQVLRKTLGDKAMDYKCYGGYEYFIKGDPDFFEACLENRKRVNKLLSEYFKKPVFEVVINKFGFGKVQDHGIKNIYEAQIDTGKMMQALLKKAQRNTIKLLNTVEVAHIEDHSQGVSVHTNYFSINVKKVFVATNGFAKELLQLDEVAPARAQVLITKPIEKLHIKGTFHLDMGFYYFRNIQNRILLGGGRNLDFEGETTTKMEQTEKIQQQLEKYLKEIILPNTPFEVEHRWSGIMGMGKTKVPIVKQVSNNVFCGVRLGGMGIAIGSQVGKELAQLL